MEGSLQISLLAGIVLVLPVEGIAGWIEVAEIGALGGIFELDDKLIVVVVEGLTIMLLLGDEKMLVAAGL